MTEPIRELSRYVGGSFIAKLPFVLVLLLVYAAPRVAFGQPNADAVRLVVQIDHGPAMALAFSPDGRLLATAQPRALVLWDVATRREIRRLVGHTDLVNDLVFSSDGRFLATASDDATARLWEVATGTEVKHFSRSKEVMRAVALAPDGQRLAAADKVGSVCVWRIQTAAVEKCLAPQTRNRIRWSIEDGRLAAVDSGREVTPDVRKLIFSSEGGELFAMGRQKIAAWEVTSGRVTREFVRLEDGPFLGLSPDGSTAALDNGTEIRFWNLNAGTLSQGYQFDNHLPKMTVFSKDGRSAATGFNKGFVQVIDLRTRSEVHAQMQGNAHEEGILGLEVLAAAFSADGRQLVTSAGDSVVRVWESRTLDLQAALRSEALDPRSIAFSPDGGQVLATDRELAIVWSLAEGRELVRLHHAPPPAYAVEHGTFSPQGTFILTGQNTIATLWDARSWKRIRTFDHGSYMRSVSVSGDEKSIVTTSVENAKVWNLSTGEVITQVTPGDGMRLHAAIFSPDSLRLATTTYFRDDRPGGETSIWDIASGNRLTNRVEARRLWDLRFSSDGLLMTAGEGPLVSIDPANWTPKRTLGLTSASTGLGTLKLTADGTRVLTSDNRIARLWDLASGREIASFNGVIQRADLSPDGKWLAARTMEGLRVLSTSDGASLPLMTSFIDGSWAVSDTAGRYDATNPDGSPGLHWVRGNDVIELGQLKNRFWVHGLLTRAWRGERLPDVGAGIEAVAPLPDVVVVPPPSNANELHVTLTDRGGGLGPVTVIVNGRRLSGEFVPKDSKPTGPVEIIIPLAGAVWRPDGQNDIQVTAENAVDRVSTRPRGVTLTKPSLNRPIEPSFYALVVGTSVFSGPKSMNLQFAAKDAADIASAIRVGANRLVGSDHVHLTLLTSDATTEAARPTKANILRAFREIARAAREEDTVLVYLAGHGLAHGTDTYYYLTQDATSADLSEAAVRQARAVSSEELSQWLRTEVHALKQLVILDTCAAGAAADELVKLVDKRTLDGDQVRALQVLKDATGSFVLMGSAADKVSYEASQYGQGVLTYALLQAMHGELPLADGNQLRVLPWFGYAVNAVPQLARDTGGIQQPLLMSARAGNDFPVAMLTAEDKGSIPIAQPRVQLLRVLCLDLTMSDSAGLQPLVRARLRDASQPPQGAAASTAAGIVYLDDVTEDLPGALVPTVQYSRTVDGVQATVRLRRGPTVVHERALTLPLDLNTAAAQLAEEIGRAAEQVKPIR